jgi:hypothetical protein
MPNYLIEYRLRIRNASTVTDPNGTADALSISSVAGGTNPYLAGPPSGDGQEIDPVTGQTRTGSYVVEVVDAATGTDGTGTIRVVTNALEDAGYLQQLLGRRAYVETRTNGGSWTSLATGYVLSIRLVAPARYAITVGDTRRVEQTQPIFTGNTLGSYVTRGCLTGGPVTATFGPVVARGGWTYKIYKVGATDDWFAEFQSGYLPYIGAPIVKDWRPLVNQTVVDTIAARAIANPASVSLFGSNQSQYVTAYRDVLVYVNGTLSTATLCGYSSVLTGETLGYNRLYFYWPSATVSSGDTVTISLVTSEVSALCPLYIDAHPVDIVTAIWTAARVKYDTGGAWITTLRNLIGPQVRLALKLTEAPVIADFLESAICGPFGLAVRTNGAGDQELVGTRILTTTVPSLTIAAGDLSSADPVVFDLDERTAINTVTLTQQTLAPATLQGAPPTAATGSNIPPDGLVTLPLSITGRYVDPATSTFAARDVTFAVPGMIHTATDWQPTPAETLNVIAQGILPRFGRGSPVAEVQVLASAASAAAQVGDEVYLETPHYPNRNYRIGESTVGARIMQVIRRTETPTGPQLRLLDSGINAQPVSPAATITIAANTNNPSLIAQFTITNAATINSGGVLSVEVEWATGSSTPTTNGAAFATYAPGTVPTGAVDLPAVIGSGVTVYARARTTQTGRRPSAWTAWASVTLTAIPTPGAITVGTTTATSVAISWTNTSTAYPLFVFAYLGGSAPAQWEPYLVTTLPPGSTSTVIRTLEAGTYQLAIAYSTPTGRGPVRTASVTTSGTGSTATRPAGIALVPLLDDATLEQGIALGLYASDQTLDFVIERSAVSGSSFGEIARVPGSTAVYVDRLARDGFTYYYRAKHALGGFVTSAATGEVSGIARGVPAELLRPAPVVPTVGVEITESSTTGTVTLVITDPQGRLTEVRFRDDPGTGVFGAWTVDSAAPYTYSATIPTTGFLRIEYEVKGFDADGIERVLASGIESFDRGRVANIVSAAGLFSTAGVLTVTVQGDTDTVSIKYAVSATPWASDAVAYAAAQAGTLINARNGTFTDAGPWSVGAVAYVAFAAYDAAGGGGNVSGPYQYVFTNGARDTKPLISRARELTTSTATVAKVRVAVNVPDPFTSTTATIRYTTQGLTGVSPADSSGNTVTTGTGNFASPETAGSFIDFDVPRPAVGAPAGMITFTATATGYAADTDPVAIAPVATTQSLIGRARVVANSGTQLTIRMAVASPVALSPNTATVSWVTDALAATIPLSPATVTPETNTTVTEPVGSYVDVTVDRPAIGGNTGRITFLVTATDRAAVSDSVDVPAIERVGPSLNIVTTPGSSSYSLAITWTGTIEYALDGATQSVSGWTSPRTETITRNDFSGAAKVASFKATKDSITIGESVNVPAKDATSATITIGTQQADDVTNEYEFSWTGSGFPSGTQYDLQYRTVTTGGTVEDGFLTNQTSPVTVTSGYSIGVSPTYQMTVYARSSDTVLMSRFRAGTFLT